MAKFWQKIFKNGNIFGPINFPLQNGNFFGNRLLISFHMFPILSKILSLTIKIRSVLWK